MAIHAPLGRSAGPELSRLESWTATGVVNEISSNFGSKRIYQVLGKSDEHVFYGALILLGLIFSAFVLANTGLLQLALTSDRSMISWVILALYSLATLHWLFRAKALDRENTLCRSVEESRSIAADLDGSYVALALNTPPRQLLIASICSIPLAMN